MHAHLCHPHDYMCTACSRLAPHTAPRPSPHACSTTYTSPLGPNLRKRLRTSSGSLARRRVAVLIVTQVLHAVGGTRGCWPEAGGSTQQAGGQAVSAGWPPPIARRHLCKTRGKEISAKAKGSVLDIVRLVNRADSGGDPPPAGQGVGGGPACKSNSKCRAGATYTKWPLQSQEQGRATSSLASSTGMVLGMTTLTPSTNHDACMHGQQPRTGRVAASAHAVHPPPPPAPGRPLPLPVPPMHRPASSSTP